MSATISGSELHAMVERIAAMGDRLCGSDVEHKAMEYIRDLFTEIGLKDTAIEWFDIHRWTPTRVELTLLPEGNNIPCKPIWYSGTTPPDGLQGECTYCHFGMPHQFGSAEGKIAVMDGRTLLHFWPTYRFFNSYQSALNAGALALIVITDTPGDLIPVFTAEEEKHDNPIPAVLTSRSGGTLLKERMKQGEVDISLHLEAEAGISRTGDVVGMLPGRSNEYVIIGAHHDSIYRGAVDNAGGIAALLAIAAECAHRPEPPHKNIIFATHPGHELLIGAREFIKKRTHLLEKTAAYITLDGVGSDNYEEIGGKVTRTGHDEPRGVFVSPNPILAEIILPLVKKYKLQPAAFLHADVMCPNEDLEGRFFEARVPIVDIIGKPIWYHTEEDTPDKCTPDQLERGTRAHLELIERIDSVPAAKMRSADRQLLDARSLIEKAPAKSSPAIEFTYFPEQPKAGEPSLIYVNHFDDQEGVLVDMEWDFGGETGSKGPVLLHVFDTPGEYVLTLTVTNTLGVEGVCQKKITVS